MPHRHLSSLLVTFLLASSCTIAQPHRVSSDTFANSIRQYFIPVPGTLDSLPTLLLDKLKGKRIVGLGEATHGTAEFERMLSLFTKELVSKQDFNVIMLEANFSDTRALNDYVVHGRGDAETALRLKHHISSPFVDEEFKELADWLRTHNAKLPEKDRVWMLGADANFPQGAAHDALRLSSELKLKLPESTTQVLADLAYLPVSMIKDYTQRNTLASMLAKTAPLHEALKRKDLLLNLDARQRWLIQSVATMDNALRFFYDHYRYGRVSKRQFRDEAMLANVQWILRERPSSKILLYSHNAHVEKRVWLKGVGDAENRFGMLLDSTYGKDYYAICTEARSGTYWGGDDDGVVNIQERKDKVGNILGEVLEAPFGFLDLNAPEDIKAFFQRSLYMTYAVIDGSWDAPTRVEGMSSAFDALLYVRESTPKRRGKPTAGLRDFSLNMNLTKDQLKAAAKKKKVTVALKSGYLPLNTSYSREGVSLGILFVSGKKKVLGYSSVPLSAEGGGEMQFPLPSGTENVLLTIMGSYVGKLELEELKLNGDKVDLDRFQLYGEGYAKALRVDAGTGTKAVHVSQR